ncbi:MAG: ABC transporter ATP-binding protein [Bryobacterales bacterium]|nr:ABC transporter ATP-binding protein [Bryobacterales bacterium]
MDRTLRHTDDLAALAGATPPPQTPLLTVDVSVSYGEKPVLRRAALTVGEGEILGLIGLSGSGKSTLGLAVLGLAGLRGARVEGRILFEGRDLLRLGSRELRRVRGQQIAFVPQSPLAALNPALTLGTQFREAWQAHSSEAGWLGRVFELLEQVNLPASEGFLRRLPQELSVGMAQRVLIAMAVLHRPRLLIADEPTSALDVITQAEIVELFRRLNVGAGTGVLYISHDLVSVAGLCHRLSILADGEIVETGETRRVFAQPEHEHTRKLVAAIPGLGSDVHFFGFGPGASR